MLRTRLEARSTNPIESMAPIKAANIIPSEPIVIPLPSQNTRQSATVSFAPEDIPSTKGPAIGLWKNVCNKKPDTERAPPSITAANTLGIRISIIIRCAISLSNISLNEKLVLPTFIPKTTNITISIIKAKKTIVYLTFPFILFKLLPAFLF
jgi:hypothetical protein